MTNVLEGIRLGFTRQEGAEGRFSDRTETDPSTAEEAVAAPVVKVETSYNQDTASETEEKRQERKRREQERRRSAVRDRYRELQDTVPESVELVEARAQKAEAEEVFWKGYSVAEAEGKKYINSLRGFFGAFHPKRIWRVATYAVGTFLAPFIPPGVAIGGLFSGEFAFAVMGGIITVLEGVTVALLVAAGGIPLLVAGSVALAVGGALWGFEKARKAAREDKEEEVFSPYREVYAEADERVRQLAYERAQTLWKQAEAEIPQVE